MSGPISIGVGALAVVGVCTQLGTNIYELQRAISGIEDEVSTLLSDVDRLKALCHTVKAAYETRSDNAIPESTEQAQRTKDLWAHLGKELEHCRLVVTKLDGIVEKIRGHSKSSVPRKIDVIGKTIRKMLKDKDLDDCRKQMATYQSALQMVLSVIIHQDIGVSQEYNTRSFGTLSQDFESLGENIQSQITDIQQSIKFKANSNYDEAALAALKDLQESVNFAALTMKSVSANHHFDVPQSVSSIFTGRTAFLQELRETFIPRNSRQGRQSQRRFVIHGLGGSGKTQFSSKFAQDNRDSFWGVFWIDASTPEQVKRTIGSIAERAGLEKHENSVLHWLSNLEHSWLLIIDNADDENIPLERYFPKGDGGNILVTTKNPAYKVHGNVGRRYYEFLGLELDEATQLLLKASDEPAPWDSTCKQLASHITTKLGSLALAIIHAGAAIRDELCNLKNYLDYYSRSWRKIRRTKMASSDSDASIYATWEICYTRLEQRGTEASLDALELLNMLAFLHWETISRDIFSRAMKNSGQEPSQETDVPAESSTPDSWSTTSFVGKLRETTPDALLAWLFRGESKGVLPRIVRDASDAGAVDDALDRLRRALKELVHMSLIIHNDRTDSYAMHPMVHTWARERPRMRLSEQALWADVTGQVLAMSINLPPLDAAAADEKYHISLLPHVEHVLACRRSTAKAISVKGSSRKYLRSWFTSLVPNLAPDADKIRMYAKFSLVYAKCGHWDSAEKLLREVKSFLFRYLGPRHKRSRQVALFLSTIHWHLGQPSVAAELQSSVLNVCIAHLGPSHPETLRAMSELGRTRWQQGQYSTARSLQREVLGKMLQSRPRDDADVLEAMDNLGLTELKFWETSNFEEAFQLHLEASTGMAKVHGPDHERTLFAKEHLCRAAVLLGGQHLDSARDTMAEVMETRRANLGKEHPYTLLAMVNMAIVLAAMGQHDEATELIRRGLPAAQRTLGPKHIGTLFGQQTLGCILVQDGQYTAAEGMLVEVAASQKEMASHRGDYHPDRLGTLVELARCSFALGKTERAITLCNEAIQGFDSISTVPHPIAKGLRTTRARLLQLSQNNASGCQAELDFQACDINFPFILFRPCDTETR
ncbi:hypothetical protein QQS21_007321 [Conoideocrella luteorostrata]|uniref:Tetratricopeptide repeat domain-containing protein n=1 Tax=Conoideocrella luteorostrata TaxID=1105319 RepID=A0AAJ0CNC7_9HYPO|nr:hypothetical protein QQS21_007321 [Conoideocrella luteorostrata]